MDYNWDKIRATLKKELQTTFDDQNQPNYPFSLEDGLDLFCKTLMFRTGEDDLDGIEIRVIPTIYKYYYTPKDKNDAFNYLTQLATKLDSFLQKIVFLFHPSDYVTLKSQNKGMFHYVLKSGININNIDFRLPLSSIPTTSLTSHFGIQLYDAYKLRNIEAHTANDFNDADIPNFLKSILVTYLFTTFEYYSQLVARVGHITIPQYINISEIVKDLTPPREYEIDLANLIGRNNDLINLEQEVEQNDNKIIALKNIGGIGKTTLLKAFIKNNKNNYNHIIWIPFQNDLINSFINNVVLLKNLNFSLMINISPFENYKLLMNNINNLSGKTLLLIDDLQEDTFENYSQLPLSTNCQIIATTRLKLSNSSIKFLEIDFLDFDSAKLLFSKHYIGISTDTLLKELFDLIGFHTLTIELLAKTLETNFTIGGLTGLIYYLKKDTISNENWQVAVQSEYDDETINLKNHLLKAFTLISLSTLETQILSYFAVLPTLQFFGNELKKLFSIEDSQNSAFIESMGLLVRKGWIIKMGDLYQMHTIIQEVIKVTIPPTFQSNFSLIKGLCNYLNVEDYSSITEKIKYISCSEHVLSIINEESDEINTLNNLVAIGLNSKGHFSTALKYAEKSLKYAKKIGDDHKVYQTYSTLGMINRHLGNLKKSLEIYEKAIDIIEGSTPKYVTSLQVYLNLATLLEQFGERKHLIQAKELYEYVFNELEFFLESNAPEKSNLILLATTLNSLGKIYTLLDEYEKAIIFQQDAYEKLVELLGDKHEITGICANNLGLAYGYNKDFINSLKYHKIAVSIQEEIFDENHPEVSISKSGLANAYKNIGEIDKAKLILKEVLEIGEKNLPKNHPTLARRKSNYAALCTEESEREIAKKLYIEAIEIDLFNYGDKSPNIGTCNLNLGSLYMQEQNWLLASKHLQIANEIYDYNKINNEFSNSSIHYLKIVKQYL